MYTYIEYFILHVERVLFEVWYIHVSYTRTCNMYIEYFILERVLFEGWYMCLIHVHVTCILSILWSCLKDGTCVLYTYM